MVRFMFLIPQIGPTNTFTNTSKVPETHTLPRSRGLDFLSVGSVGMLEVAVFRSKVSGFCFVTSYERPAPTRPRAKMESHHLDKGRNL